MTLKSNTSTCLAIDMGAGSVRIMLGTLSDNNIKYEEIHRVTNEIVQFNGHERWDIDTLFKNIREGIQKALIIADPVPSSAGVDSWGVDYVLLDKNGMLIDMPVAYRDKRTEGMMEKWKAELSEFETFKRTGINFYIFNTLFQLLSQKGSAHLEKTQQILFIPSYINYLLSGKKANEQTISSTSQMLHINGKEWDKLILDKLGLDDKLLNPIVLPGEKLGKVKPEVAPRASLENIAVGCHDTACVVASIPAKTKNFAYLSAGTWCIVGIESDQALITEEAFQEGFTNERGYGNTFRILKNIVGLWIIQGLKRSLAENITYAEMEKMTESGSDPVQYINPEDPLFYNPDDMQEAFKLFFAKTDQPQPDKNEDYIKIAYDSLCFSFKYYIERLEQLSHNKLDTIHVIGGGSQSDYLNQRIATICRKEVISGPVEGATLGNIMIQGISMGYIKNIEEGRKMIGNSYPGTRYKPGEENKGLTTRYADYLKSKTSSLS